MTLMTRQLEQLPPRLRTVRLVSRKRQSMAWWMVSAENKRLLDMLGCAGWFVIVVVCWHIAIFWMIQGTAYLRIRGGSQQTFTLGGLTPYPFIYHFSQKRYPFHIPSIDKWYPFHIPCLELCNPFNCCKYTLF